MKKLTILLTLILIVFLSQAQIYIVRNGKPKGRIFVQNTNEHTAEFLNLFIKKITGITLPVISQQILPKKGDIIFENATNKEALNSDGFLIKSNNEFVKIITANDESKKYAIVHLLEKFWGIKYYAADALTITHLKDLSLPTGISITEIPSFRYRQTQAYSLKDDSLYRTWFRLREPNEFFAANYWVHTFDRILPSVKYGSVHPEYYSFINGMRRPGTASQWCISNPEVFEVVSKQIDSIFKANPGQNIISVSQNDGNNTNCSCNQCKAIDSLEGSPSGNLIRFLNKLAARFPDKQFSTLAYLYSMNPPKLTKPLPNVNIMLCDIDCYREVPLPENNSGRYFLKALDGWSKISNNIFLWDYGINFDNYVSPFPNLHILQPNMRIFKDHHVQMHFSQIGGSKGGDFSELRSFLVSKLMWNVNYNIDSLMQDFLYGYYGKAAPFLYQYIKLQEGALLASNIPLWIYDTPITHKNGMLNTALLKRYHSLFDAAEQAVSHDNIFLKRVQQQRLSLQYAELEIARTKNIDDIATLKANLALFRNRANKLKITTLNERNNTIEEYCDLYETRYLPNNKINFAVNAIVDYTLPPSKPYDKISNTALTDGLLGGATFNESWIGWEGKNAEFVIDLGSSKTFETVEADFLHKLGAWIFLPKSFSCAISQDKMNFTPIGKTEMAEDRTSAVKYVTIGVTAKQKVTARYVRINIENIGSCPSWHYGVGYPAWFFMDEVWVR